MAPQISQAREIGKVVRQPGIGQCALMYVCKNIGRELMWSMDVLQRNGRRDNISRFSIQKTDRVSEGLGQAIRKR